MTCESLRTRDLIYRVWASQGAQDLGLELSEEILRRCLQGLAGSIADKQSEDLIKSVAWYWKVLNLNHHAGISGLKTEKKVLGPKHVYRNQVVLPL